MSVLSRVEARQQRHRRIRKKISGTAGRPRMALSVSRKRMAIQFIDDSIGATIVSVRSEPDAEPKNVAGARALGERAGKALLEKGVKEIVVDRGGFRFHGRVRAMVEGAMASGIVAGSSVLAEPAAQEPEKPAKAQKEAK